MNINSIANKITSLFSTTRSPAPQIPGILMAAGATQMPGLSVSKSCGKVASRLMEHGIPTDALPDGTENKTLVLVKAIVEEVYRAIREDSNTQIVFPPGAISIMTMGANGGGPMVSQGININFPKGNAVTQ